MTYLASPAVLIIAYRRTTEIERILQECKENHIDKIYVALDGPIDGNTNGERDNSAIREIVTNYRKTYYETQELDRISMWSSIFTSIYFILLIVLTFEIAFSDTLSLAVKFSILLLLYLYPFLINWCVLLLYKLMVIFF